VRRVVTRLTGPPLAMATAVLAQRHVPLILPEAEQGRSQRLRWLLRANKNFDGLRRVLFGLGEMVR
jgi:hypothetical protein